MDARALLRAASEARAFARVPGSGFRVGAALLTRDGSVVTGCNVEIDSTRASICAERTALVKAVSMGHGEFIAIAVVSDADEPVAPCGFCRQFLVDFGLDIEVVMANSDLSRTVTMTSGELMPMAFLGNQLRPRA